MVRVGGGGVEPAAVVREEAARGRVRVMDGSAAVVRGEAARGEEGW